MNTDLFKEVSDVFHEVRSAGPEERARLLSERCGAREELRREVERLLAQDGERDDGLDDDQMHNGLHLDVVRGLFTTGGSPFADASSWEETLPTVIGQYRIIRRIGEGGMGIVCEAEQDNPRRLVAIKILRVGLDSRGMLRRFAYEAQILARLHHPGIARIYEAGVAQTVAGTRPYFAMELISGRPLLEHAETRRLGIQERLNLFLFVCDAVEYAHQKGVIHRDLKPANILVDEHGQPRILDFGVARVTDGDVQATTMQTSPGQLLGTLPYMSPEQFGGNIDAVDTRSDVYSMGVALYQLLSGKLPHDTRSLSILEAARMIRDEEPSRLGTIDTSLRGELEIMVARALEKDPDRRYQSAAALASDVRRYLRHEPIEARPQTRTYQLRKFARRHPELVGGLGVAAAALLAGMVGTGWALVRAVANRDEALRLNEFILSSLGPGSPTSAERRALVSRTLEDVIRQAGTPRDALDQVRLFESLSSRFGDLGLFPESVRFAGQARSIASNFLGPEHGETLRIQGSLAERMCRGSPSADQLDEANRIAEQAVAIAHRQRTELDALVRRLTAIWGWTQVRCGRQEGGVLLKERWDALQADPAADPWDVGQAATRLAWAEDHQFRLLDAERLWRTASEVFLTQISPPDVYESLNARCGLAHTLHKQGRDEEASEILRLAIPEAEVLLGPSLDQPLLFDLLDKQAAVDLNRGAFADSAAASERIISHVRSLRPSGDPANDVASVPNLDNLALALAFDGRLKDADAAFARAIEIAERMGAAGSKESGTALARERALFIGLRIGVGWASEAIQTSVRTGAVRNLAGTPGASDARWGDLRFALARWDVMRAHGAALDPAAVQVGGLDQLQRMRTPEPGLCFLQMVVPRTGAAPLPIGEWVWLGDWNVSFFDTPYSAGGPDGRPVWAERVAREPDERRRVWGFNKDQAYDIGWGPGGKNRMFGLTANTAFTLPEGRYRFEGDHRDGFVVRVDGRPRYDLWDCQTAAFGFDATLDGSPHTMSLEYFEYLGGAVLRLTARPLGAEAEAFEQAVARSVP